MSMYDLYLLTIQTAAISKATINPHQVSSVGYPRTAPKLRPIMITNMTRNLDMLEFMLNDIFKYRDERTTSPALLCTSSLGAYEHHPLDFGLPLLGTRSPSNGTSL